MTPCNDFVISCVKNIFLATALETAQFLILEKAFVTLINIYFQRKWNNGEHYKGICSHMSCR